jgi:CTP-dependent riboflavin kinase
MIMLLGLATGLSLNQAARQLIESNQDENIYRQQQMLNGQYIKMTVNGASTICGRVDTVIHQ